MHSFVVAVAYRRPIFPCFRPIKSSDDRVATALPRVAHTGA